MGVEKEIEHVEERGGGGEGSGQRRDVKRSNFEVFFSFTFLLLYRNLNVEMKGCSSRSKKKGRKRKKK